MLPTELWLLPYLTVTVGHLVAFLNNAVLAQLFSLGRWSYPCMFAGVLYYFHFLKDALNCGFFQTFKAWDVVLKPNLIFNFSTTIYCAPQF